jgi:hypothetical protein
MPTNRAWRGRKGGQGSLSLGAIAFLRDDPYDPRLGGDLWPGNEHSWLTRHDDEPYVLLGPNAMRKVSGMSARQLVERYGDEYIKDYVAEYPGERPAWWWRFNTPEPMRRRLGGVGAAWHGSETGERYPNQQDSRGVPLVFVTDENLHWWGKPPGPPIDPKNPPQYESESAFLDRHGLLSEAERAQLEPADFEPESIL